MAENEMVKEQLTEAMIEAGAELTVKLDEAGLPVTAALWFFIPEINEWRLLFASPEVSSKGPRKVYEQIQGAIEALGTKGDSVPLSIVGVLDADADLARSLKIAVRTAGHGVNKIRFSKNLINGQFIDDALIYRAA
jgi:hypothetical protein